MRWGDLGSRFGGGTFVIVAFPPTRSWSVIRGHIVIATKDTRETDGLGPRTGQRIFVDQYHG